MPTPESEDEERHQPHSTELMGSCSLLSPFLLPAHPGNPTLLTEMRSRTINEPQATDQVKRLGQAASQEVSMVTCPSRARVHSHA